MSSESLEENGPQVMIFEQDEISKMFSGIEVCEGCCPVLSPPAGS